MQNIGVYSGSFDPFTLGHASILEQAFVMFDRVIVAIGINPAKTPYLDADTRVKIIDKWAARNGYGKNVIVVPVTNEYLADFAERSNATIIRGIRNAQDYEYEQTVFDVNKVIVPHIKTVYFFTDQRYRNISSSLVKGMVGFQNWKDRVGNFVPPETLTAIESRLK